MWFTAMSSMMHRVIDVILVLAISLAALGGWRRGFVTSALSAAGWLAGLVLGLWAVPRLLDLADLRPDSEVTSALVVLLGALVLATVLAGLLSMVGVRVATALHWRPVRLIDSGLGALAMAFAAMLAGWAVLSSARPLMSDDVVQHIDASHGWRALDRTVPDSARSAVDDLNTRLESSPFPQVFEHNVPSSPAAIPDAASVTTPAVDRARESVLKIRSSSQDCRGVAFGSGWVVSDNRVVTNAHVVAGGERITVQPGGDGRRLRATVVAFDPQLDLAILRVPDLDERPLPRAADLAEGAPAVAAGFPNGGDYHLSPAAVSDESVTGGRDIYDDRLVNRDIFTLSTTVIPGNSGGPLITPDGRVAGTIFAKAQANDTIGFALTDDATDSVLDRAAALREPVSTGSCLAHRAE